MMKDVEGAEPIGCHYIRRYDQVSSSNTQVERGINRSLQLKPHGFIPLDNDYQSAAMSSFGHSRTRLSYHLNALLDCIQTKIIPAHHSRFSLAPNVCWSS